LATVIPWSATSMNCPKNPGIDVFEPPPIQGEGPAIPRIREETPIILQQARVR
jgi:hypothetical protein